MKAYYLLFLAFALSSNHSFGQNEYQPGEARLTPTIDLHLQPVYLSMDYQIGP